MVPEAAGARDASSTCWSISTSAIIAPARARTEQALEIAEAVDRASHLNLRGLQAYSVVGSHAGGRRSASASRKKSFAHAVASARRSWLAQGLSTEIRLRRQHRNLGNRHCAARGDRIAGRIVRADGPGVSPRRPGFPARASRCWRRWSARITRVSSPSTPDYKAFSTDRGYGPEAANLPGSTYRWGGDEFGYVDVPDGLPKLGSRLEFIPPHCDPTVNLIRHAFMPAAAIRWKRSGR